MIDFIKLFGMPMEQVFGETLCKLQKQELLKIDGDRVFLTDKGIDVSNYVFAEFLL